jgi:hypothetical protein
MRQNGVQPKNIDGSAQVEKRAEEKWQVETGILPNYLNLVDLAPGVKHRVV